MNDVLAALRERIAAGSRPGERTDGWRIALSIEGGGSRSAYSAGMAMAVEELGLLPAFDAVYGTSGGGLNAAWLLSGEGSRWLPSWGWDEVLAERVVYPPRVFRGGVVVDTRHLVERVYSAVTPMNFGAILANPISLHPLAVDGDTRQVADLAPLITDQDSLRAALRATTALPLLAGRPVRLGGREWFDGGLAEKVPLATPLAQGVTHLVVLRTVPESATPRSSRGEALILDAYFAARRRFRTPPTGFEQPVDQKGAAVVQIWSPEDGPEVGRLSRDGAAISRAVEMGRTVALEALSPADAKCGPDDDRTEADSA
ncbi:Patatin OS=Tsukamurella paurometabola (strain ATCC 8368 / DSM / CCUG 35730 / CIP 100753 / JCM 10117 / KCTC 9821 / NBRC 16120 / NCIMB 702349 / NCTC 13040)OX=521096 GN=Tpau_0935 PE=4 SV=1 [Tsukamurella paurometabola]|uniref:Patatin n=1 Tax=Tsukamurella paurometabola (strain ATCC 8368 / DSM 20162 / CCUG 35730 / CIP 100753 / JCM 10117 / KCTC 9821 / NBRC 16120 / NCIMB 702349 / NCTC 13040) TaxID=521096 RepID=D5UUJ7_TSUPD|nr:patatin-like phospholipase family protein [Tsukamurella paurometabola]ADG77568.1 Patatin [Tsukamurella paurometabola DSM 20162]SUP27748.1 Patatin-like phospholipase [Tsukamurella paurometabola]